MNEALKALEHFRQMMNNGSLKAAVFSTSNDSIPFSRFVILREYDFEDSCLKIYTNSNSSKIEQIKANPNSNIAWYDPEKQIQIIFHGISKIESDENYINQIKSTIPSRSHKDYLGLCPGQEYSSKEAKELQLSIIKFYFSKIDILILRKSEHLRFQLQPIANPPDGNIEFNITRLTP